MAQNKYPELSTPKDPDNIKTITQKVINVLLEEADHVCNLRVPVPPTTNKAYHNVNKKDPRTGVYGRRKTKAYKNFTAEANFDFLKQKIGCGKSIPENLPDNIAVVYSYYFPDRTRRDIANFEKLVSDFLVGAGVIVDDDQIDFMVLGRRRLDKDDPRVEISIFKLTA